MLLNIWVVNEEHVEMYHVVSVHVLPDAPLMDVSVSIFRGMYLYVYEWKSGPHHLLSRVYFVAQLLCFGKQHYYKMDTETDNL